ncbi:hypothetical protein HPB47_003228, partial [Ixodes persulcatus]
LVVKTPGRTINQHRYHVRSSQGQMDTQGVRQDGWMDLPTPSPWQPQANHKPARQPEVPDSG